MMTMRRMEIAADLMYKSQLIKGERLHPPETSPPSLLFSLPFPLV